MVTGGTRASVRERDRPRPPGTKASLTSCPGPFQWRKPRNVQVKLDLREAGGCLAAVVLGLGLSSWGLGDPGIGWAWVW